MKKEMPKQRKKVSSKFTGILALISIVGFLEIVILSFFELDLREYSGFFWLMIMGIGFIIIARPRVFYKRAQESFTELSFYRLTTMVIGAMAIIAGFLSLPQFNLIHPIFLAVKGVISIIAIIFIIFQTWITRD